MRHVKEAYRLTNKSIIRVDQPNVDLEEDDTPVPEEAADDLMETDEAAPKPSKKAFKLSYEKHKKMSFLLIKLVREKQAEGKTSAGAKDIATTKASLRAR